jgi:hypothetical protein
VTENLFPQLQFAFHLRNKFIKKVLCFTLKTMENKDKHPEWLNEAFMEKALSSFKNDDSVKVLDLKFSSNFSQHYGSSMFQCQINFKTKSSDSETLPVVIKFEPLNNDLKMNIVAGSLKSFFTNEVRMYSETIPAIKKLFAKHGYNDEFAPE